MANILSNTLACKDLNSTTIEEICESARLQTIKANMPSKFTSKIFPHLKLILVVYRKYQIVDRCYILSSGSIRLFAIDPIDGHTTLPVLISSGQMFGEFEILSVVENRYS